MRQVQAATSSSPGDQAVLSERYENAGQTWEVLRFSRRLKCTGCGELYADPDPRLFSFNDSSGACSTCEGFGLESFIDEAKIVP
ncbi:MAG: hypothetical protein ACKO9H_08305, partial [Planctomycetota bacterium]